MRCQRQGAPLTVARMVFAVGIALGAGHCTQHEATDAASAVSQADAAGVDSAHNRPHTPTKIAQVTHLSPAYGPTSGLTVVTIFGGGFDTTSDVLFGETPAQSFKVLDAGRLQAVAPPRPPGLVDLTVRLRHEDEQGEVSFEDLQLAAAFRYIAPVAVSVVDPASGPSLGGAVVTITGAGFSQGTQFLFGDRLGIDPVVIDEHTATVVTPASQPGAVSVRAVNHAGSARLKDSYTYLDTPAHPIDTKQFATLLTSTPYYLDMHGGTAVKMAFKPGLDVLGQVVSMRVGALAAASVEVAGGSASGEAVLTAVAPKGSPGPADLVIVFEHGALVAPKAFIYESKVPFIAAVLPATGAQAGGTWTRVVGSGLGKINKVRFGDKPGLKLQVKDDALAWVWTPPGKAGVVDVTAHFGALTSTLGQGYIYFDPASGNLGTWGAAIEHTVNVTVTQRYVSDGGPVQGAWVLLGHDTKTPYKGLTDANGQITFSGPGLGGPAAVSASKPDHTAASVIGFDTENVTLLLRNRKPPSSGVHPPSKPKKQFSPGTIEGRVVGAKKYVQLPMGTCSGHDVVAGQCAPCDANGDCAAGTTCELLSDPLSGFSLGGAGAATVTDQRYCAAACLVNSDCPPSFECRAISLAAGAQKYRCVPQIGEPQTRCEVSRYSFFKKNDDPGKGWIADPQTGDFSIGSRLGEVAVFCRGGYARASDGAFVALAMGLQRNVQVQSGETVKGLKIQLDIPLRRRIRARLEDLPLGDDTAGHVRYVDAKLELGGDGWIPMAYESTTQRTDTIELPSQPDTLAGPLKGVHYAFYAGLSNPLGFHLMPLSLAWAEKLQPDHGDTFAWWPAGQSKPEPKTTFAAPISAVAQAGDLAVGVGDGGSIAVWSGQGWTPQSSPTSADLSSVWLSPGGAGWAVGAVGTVAYRDPTLGWQASPSPTTQDIVAVTGGVNGVWLLDADHRIFRRKAGKWLPHSAPLGKVVPKPVAPGVVTESERLRGLWQSPDGRLFAGADGGRWFIATFKDEKLVWSEGAPKLTYRVRGFAAGAGSDVWLLGDRGTLAKWSNNVLTTFALQTRQPLHAGRLINGVMHAVGGQGAWVTVGPKGVQDRSLSLGVDLRGIVHTDGGIAAAGHAVVSIGPYLEMPHITTPSSGAGISDSIAWEVNGGNTPDLNWVTITGYYEIPEWDIIARGDLNSVKLPSFSALGGFNPLPVGGLNIYVTRILEPSISVNRFNYKKLSLYHWTSYARGHKQAVVGLGQGGQLP